MAPGSFPIRGGVVTKDTLSLSIQNLAQATGKFNQPEGDFEIVKEVTPAIICGVKSVDQITNQVTAVGIKTDASANNRLMVDNDGVEITMSAATAVSVGVADGALVAANPLRRYLLLCNTSAARVSLAFTGAAVLDSGVTIQPGGAYEISAKAGNLTLQVIRAIASGAASNVAVQEGV